MTNKQNEMRADTTPTLQNDGRIVSSKEVQCVNKNYVQLSYTYLGLCTYFAD